MSDFQKFNALFNRMLLDNANNSKEQKRVYVDKLLSKLPADDRKEFLKFMRFKLEERLRLIKVENDLPKDFESYRLAMQAIAKAKASSKLV